MFFKTTKKLYCPRCFHEFNENDNKSNFQTGKTACPKCHHWIDNDEKIGKRKIKPIVECKNLIPLKIPKRKVKFIPSKILAKNPKPDIEHYCKPDYYKYEMFKAIGSQI